MLGANLQRLSAGWQAAWVPQLELAESFVNLGGCDGRVYQAVNWLELGGSQRNSRSNGQSTNTVAPRRSGPLAGPGSAVGEFATGFAHVHTNTYLSPSPDKRLKETLCMQIISDVETSHITRRTLALALYLLIIRNDLFVHTYTV